MKIRAVSTPELQRLVRATERLAPGSRSAAVLRRELERRQRCQQITDERRQRLGLN